MGKLKLRERRFFVDNPQIIKDALIETQHKLIGAMKDNKTWDYNEVAGVSETS